MVAWEDWKSRKITVMDESKRHTFYTAESDAATKDLAFYTTHNSEQIAAITYGLDMSSVTISMNGSTLEIKPTDWKGGEWVYQSTTLLNAAGDKDRIMWKGMVSMMCTNESGITIARFKAAKLTLHRIGTIEFMDENISQQVKNEIVVTGTALMAMEYKPSAQTIATNNIAMSYLVTNAVVQASNSS